jgi:hypothetical protein
MPKTVIDFSETIFYKIVCKDLTLYELYVGHTTNFRQRKSQHKSACNKETGKSYKIRLYNFIRENGGWDNWDMIVINRQSCADQLEAHTVERNYIETLNAMLNCYVPTRTIEEWKEINKGTLEEKRKLYYETNKDIIQEKRSIFYRENLDRIKEQHATYYQKNYDRIRKVRALSYHLNRDKVRESQLLYSQNNKENKKHYDALYREANKEAIKLRKKIAYENK